MTKGELLQMLTEMAKEYRQTAPDSLRNNRHMNDIRPDTSIDPVVIDAVLVDFINHVGARMGVDYALYTRDLREADENHDSESPKQGG